MNYDDLRPWATVRQLEYIEALEKYGSTRKAAAALGVRRSAVDDALKSMRVKAARQGYSPAHNMTRTAPDGFHVKGTSTLYNADGGITQQWVKTNIDQERQAELARIAVEALAEDVRGLAPITKIPKHTRDELLCVYPLGDPHFGMYAWAAECGEDFDTEKAKALTLGAVDRLVQAAPAASTAIILPLGDIFHANDQSNQTPAHKHQLDVDSRFVRVLRIGIETFRHAILRALEKHDKVIVRFVRGNHDPEAVWALAFATAAFFDKEPRVEVDLSPSRFWFYRFGRVFIGATHGDSAKHDALPGVMAADRAQDWGATLYRYWYTGHIHKTMVNEYPGVTCESFRTLAAKDAYAAGHGYRAGRDMRCIVHHKDFGEVERHRVDVGMLEAA